MLLLIIFLLLDGLGSLVFALAIYTNRAFIMDLKPLQDRRLENLDSAILYFSRRILQVQKARDKASLLVMQTEAHIPEFHDYAQRLAIADNEIKVLKDVVNYLKLC